jgi:hypothetical protein
MPLTPKQAEAVNALDWLLNEDARREGRTMAFAVALIRQALRRPRQRIAYLDHLHAVTQMARDRAEATTREYVRHLIGRDARLRGIGGIEQFEHYLQSNGRVAIYDWWPSDEALGDGIGLQLDLEPPAPRPDDSLVRQTFWDKLENGVVDP